MPGPILFLITPDGAKEPAAIIPNLNTFEAQAQVTALEAQANAMDKMLVIAASFQDWPKHETDPSESAENGQP